MKQAFDEVDDLFEEAGIVGPEEEIRRILGF